MEIPKSSSISSRPLAIGNSGILSGFSGDIFKMAVQLRRSAEFISEANARFFGHTTCPSPSKSGVAIVESNGRWVASASRAVALYECLSDPSASVPVAQKNSVAADKRLEIVQNFPAHHKPESVDRNFERRLRLGHG